MAYKIVRKDTYLCDSANDLVNIKEKDMGASCYVLDEGTEYRLLSTGEWVKQSAVAGSSDGEVDLTGYATEAYVDEAISAIDIPSVEGLATTDSVKTTLNTAKEYTDAKAREVSNKIPSVDGLATETALEEVASNPILKAFDFTRNPSREDGQSIYLSADEPKTLQEMLVEKGIGLYNVWISKGRNQDLPQSMIDDNTSGRGFACVDLQYTQTNPERFIGYVVLFDKLNNMYYRFFNKGTAGPWMKVATTKA